jgi:hypothetical protein
VHQERGAHAASPPTEDRTAFRGGRPLGQMRQVERTCKQNHMKIETKTPPDVLVRNEGTVFLFCPLTPRAKVWIDEYVQSDAQWFGNALMVEHRYAWGLAQAMKDEGLVLA